MDMKKLKTMPRTSETVGSMWSKCMDSFFATPQGMQYKQRHEQLEHEMDKLHYEIDGHVAKLMRDKFV